MTDFSAGNAVRIDIPDETDPDHNQYHGDHGHIIDIKGEITTITGEYYQPAPSAH